jgi:hypothetical protein
MRALREAVRARRRCSRAAARESTASRFPNSSSWSSSQEWSSWYSLSKAARSACCSLGLWIGLGWVGKSEGLSKEWGAEEEKMGGD